MTIRAADVITALSHQPDLLFEVHELLLQHFGSVKPDFEVQQMSCPYCHEEGRPFASWDGDTWYWHLECQCHWIEKNLDPPEWPFLTEFPSMSDWKKAGYEIV